MEVWAPTPDDVAKVVRVRTKDDAGVELGVFTRETSPTYDDVIPLIDTTVARILNKVGRPIPESVVRVARRIAAVGVACQVELSYWPEQVSTGRSPYEQLKVEYDEGVAELVTAAQADDGDASTDDLIFLASDSFDDVPLVCMRTRF